MYRAPSCWLVSMYRRFDCWLLGIFLTRKKVATTAFKNTEVADENRTYLAFDDSDYASGCHIYHIVGSIYKLKLYCFSIVFQLSFKKRCSSGRLTALKRDHNLRLFELNAESCLLHEQFSTDKKTHLKYLGIFFNFKLFGCKENLDFIVLFRI